MSTPKKPKAVPKLAAIAGKMPLPRRAYVIAALAILWLVIIGVGLVLFYHGRALPNVSTGGLQVGNMTSDEIRTAINQLPEPNVTFNNAGQKLKVPLSTIGVKIDVDSTLREVLRIGRRSDWLSNLWLWQTRQIPLVFANDPGKLKLFLQTHYPSIFIDPKDAQLMYNPGLNQFTIKPGSEGRGVDLRAFEASLPELALNPHDIELQVKPGPVKPLIGEDGLQLTRKSANKRIRLAVQFKLHDKVVYKADIDSIASWIHFIPNFVDGTSHVEFDQAKIKQYITSTVSPSIIAPPVARKVVIDRQSDAKNIISAGQDGHVIDNADTLANNILQALKRGEDIEQTVTIVPAHYKTVTMKGYGKWIEVDLTKQTTTLYVGDNPVASYLISSGRARTPTRPGEFAIYAKMPLKTMTGTILGEYYYVPDIPWVSFFDGGEAFHGTYWHHNFGHPMSHGCINMTIADAKVLYDFAPIGTKVIVHY